jgi:hypothetical protein
MRPSSYSDQSPQKIICRVLGSNALVTRIRPGRQLICSRGVDFLEVLWFLFEVSFHFAGLHAYCLFFEQRQSFQFDCDLLIFHDDDPIR